jgi:hypothetical protein
MPGVVQTAIEVARRDLTALRVQRETAMREFDEKIDALETAIRIMRNVYGPAGPAVLALDLSVGPLERVRAVLKNNPRPLTPIEVRQYLIAGGQRPKGSLKATDQMVHQCLRRLVVKEEVRKVQLKPRKATYEWITRQ